MQQQKAVRQEREQEWNKGLQDNKSGLPVYTLVYITYIYCNNRADLSARIKKTLKEQLSNAQLNVNPHLNRLTFLANTTAGRKPEADQSGFHAKKK